MRPVPTEVVDEGLRGVRPRGPAPPGPRAPPLPGQRLVHSLDPAVLPRAAGPRVLVPHTPPVESDRTVWAAARVIIKERERISLGATTVVLTLSGFVRRAVRRASVMHTTSSTSRVEGLRSPLEHLTMKPSSVSLCKSFFMLSRSMPSSFAPLAMLMRYSLCEPSSFVLHWKL